MMTEEEITLNELLKKSIEGIDKTITEIGLENQKGFFSKKEILKSSLNSKSQNANLIMLKIQQHEFKKFSKSLDRFTDEMIKHNEVIKTGSKNQRYLTLVIAFFALVNILIAFSKVQ